jgi:hypothetical protein
LQAEFLGGALCGFGHVYQTFVVTVKKALTYSVHIRNLTKAVNLQNLFRILRGPLSVYLDRRLLLLTLLKLQYFEIFIPKIVNHLLDGFHIDPLL